MKNAVITNVSFENIVPINFHNISLTIEDELISQKYLKLPIT